MHNLYVCAENLTPFCDPKQIALILTTMPSMLYRSPTYQVANLTKGPKKKRGLFACYLLVETPRTIPCPIPPNPLDDPELNFVDTLRHVPSTAADRDKERYIAC